MPNALLEQGNDVRVDDAVKDFLALTAGLDDVHLPQPPHVVRNRRLGYANLFGQRRNVHFLFHDSGKDAHAAGIAKGAEEFSHMSGGMFIKDKVGIIHKMNT
jgi:hypothetical protein